MPVSGSRVAFGAIIQLLHHSLHLGIGDLPEFGSLREVLSYQAIGVLIGSALAGAVGIEEVGGCRYRLGHGFVAGKLRAIIPT